MTSDVIIQKSACGKYIRMTFDKKDSFVITIEEWSQKISRPGEFFAASKVTSISKGGKYEEMDKGDE